MRTTTPDWLKPYLQGYGTFTHDGEEHVYAIVSKAMGIDDGGLELFALCTKDGVLGVSDSCPEKWRELVLIHELMEHRHAHKTPSLCRDMLLRELEIAKERGVDMKAYLRFRLDFFEGLVRYYARKEKPSNRETELLVRLSHALFFLREQTGTFV